MPATPPQPDAATTPAAHEFLAPARVNLIGEHTDYTGGLVLPMAIPFYTTASIQPSRNGRYLFRSELFPDVRDLATDDRSAAVGNWSDYPVGVLRQLQERGFNPPAFELRLGGNVPFGSGLSSSASVEVASALAMLSCLRVALGGNDIATLCQRAENLYVHSPCGIMDQFVVANASAGHALLIDTRSLTFEHIPMNRPGLAETRIVVCNSMVKHSVATGDYGQRRRELEAGQAILLAAFPQLRDLGDATPDHLAACAAAMQPESLRRCRHVISENARVREAKQAMLAGDATRLGRLMLASHASQRDDFECSCDEVDFLVETAVSLPGCFGARLTGGGFGGCTVNLVHQDHTEAFAEALRATYRKSLHREAEIYICEAVDGAMRRNGLPDTESDPTENPAAQLQEAPHD